MKLWLVIITAGQIGAAVGPLPYDGAECYVRAEAMQSELRQRAADAVARGLPVDVTDWRVRCVTRDTRPALGEVVQ